MGASRQFIHLEKRTGWHFDRPDTIQLESKWIASKSLFLAMAKWRYGRWKCPDGSRATRPRRYGQVWRRSSAGRQLIGATLQRRSTEGWPGEGRVKMAKAEIGVAEVWGRIWVWQDGGEDRWAWLRGGIK